MRTRMAQSATLILLGGTGFLALSLAHGQNRPAGNPIQPVAHSEPPRGFAKLTVLQQQMHLSAQHGAEWLRRANRADGRFVPGYLPDLKAPMEGDHFLHQAGAAFGLARAARFLGDERYAAVSRQAVLTLFLDTATDAADPMARHTTWPSPIVNRLGSAGLLVLAVNELPSPGDDLLDQSEQLCQFLRRQQRADGSLTVNEAPEANQTGSADASSLDHHPGVALYGLMLSQRHRPAPWKTDVVRKALAYYRPWWRQNKSPASVPWQTAAYAEAYVQSKEQPFADFVYEMNDWLCNQQYVQLDPRHPLWTGGFMGWADGKPSATAPTASSAAYGEALAEACRTARQAPDLPRYQRYREALERCLQFVVSLQYTDANTQHFTDWYRPVLVGGYHASHQDGRLRTDYTQHAVCALVQYLANAAE